MALLLVPKLVVVDNLQFHQLWVEKGFQKRAEPEIMVPLKFYRGFPLRHLLTDSTHLWAGLVMMVCYIDLYVISFCPFRLALISKTGQVMELLPL